jgi:hypothetical protein
MHFLSRCLVMPIDLNYANSLFVAVDTVIRQVVSYGKYEVNLLKRTEAEIKAVINFNTRYLYLLTA